MQCFDFRLYGLWIAHLNSVQSGPFPVQAGGRANTQSGRVSNFAIGTIAPYCEQGERIIEASTPGFKFFILGVA